VDVEFDGGAGLWFATCDPGSLDGGLHHVFGAKWSSLVPERTKAIGRLPTIARRLPWQRMSQLEMVAERPVENVDMLEALSNPHLYLNRKVRIEGRIVVTSFESAHFLDLSGQSLDLCLSTSDGLEDVCRAVDILPRETPLELLGYLEWGGYYAHDAGVQLTVVEAYPLAARAEERAALRNVFIDVAKRYDER
jgi:hypothetical protein